MVYEQIIFWGKFIFIGITMLAAVIGGIVSYKNFPPKRWGDALWILAALIYFILGLMVGLIVSLLIRDYLFEIYNVTNPYINLG